MAAADPASRLSSRARTRPAKPATALPLVSVVIVNFRQWDNTLALVGQLDRSDLVRSGQAEVVLVDNDHRPPNRRQSVRRRPLTQLRSFGTNRGFSRAVNEGCRIAAGRWLLLLNPDLEVPDEFLDDVLLRAEILVNEQPDAGVIGYRLRHADGSAQGSAGPEPTLGNVLFGLLKPRARRRCKPLAGDRPQEVPWVTGCCLLVRRECWDAMAGFDEDFFLYYEDVDLCRRARAAGWSVWYEPRVAATHYRPLHVRAVPPPLRVMTRHALLTYAAKHWPRWQVRVLASVVALEARCRSLIAGRAAAQHFRRLLLLTRDLVTGRGVRARARLLASARALNG